MTERVFWQAGEFFLPKHFIVAVQSVEDPGASARSEAPVRPASGYRVVPEHRGHQEQTEPRPFACSSGDLCKEVRHHAVFLVGSFDTPWLFADRRPPRYRPFQYMGQHRILDYIPRKSLILSGKSSSLASSDSELEDRKNLKIS